MPAAKHCSNNNWLAKVPPIASRYETERERKEMSQKVYVGGLSWDTKDDELKRAFETFGEVEEAIVIKDRMTDRSRGFGFVTFAENDAAAEAIEKMNGTELDGRTITVNEARERRSGGGGGGGRGRGGGGGGGRGGRGRDW